MFAIAKGTKAHMTIEQKEELEKRIQCTLEVSPAGGGVLNLVTRLQRIRQIR
jgi:hypothetical protein